MITIGPSLGGALVAAAGPGVGVGCNAISFLLCAALMRGITAPPLDRAPQRFLADLAEGWLLVRGTPWIWVTTLGSAFLVAFWHVGYGIVGLTFVQIRMGGPAAWGVIASSPGAGMVAGALIAIAWRPRRVGYVNCLAGMPMALPGLAMVTGAPLGVVMASVMMAATGMAVAAVAWRSVVQQRIPEHQQGRVAALIYIGEIGLTPIAYLMVGPAVTALGLSGTLLVCAAGLTAATLVPLSHPAVRRLTLLR